MKAATSFFGTLDYDNTGVIDRKKLRKYVIEQMKHANSLEMFDEDAFEKGF